MGGSASVIVATYGDERWADLAHERAAPSAERQGCEVVLHHGPSLHEARNMGASLATGDRLIFLDADDELEPGCVDALLHNAQPDELRAPAVRYVGAGAPLDNPPVAFDDRDIRRLNPCVIGTAVDRDLFCDVGGFHDWPVYEDWELWLRCVKAGAEIVHVPDAVYRAHVNPDGRNAPARAVAERTYRKIRRLHRDLARHN